MKREVLEKLKKELEETKLICEDCKKEIKEDTFSIVRKGYWGWFVLCDKCFDKRLLNKLTSIRKKSAKKKTLK